MDLQKQISDMCTVTGLQCSEKFKKVKGPGRAKLESTRNNTIVTTCRNLHLYEDEPYKESRSKSSLSDDFAPEYEISAAIKSTNAEITYSNERLERRWRMNEENSDDACSSAVSTNIHHIDEEKFKKNALVSSLLKQHREKINSNGCSGKCNVEAATKDRNNHKNVGKNSTSPHFIRDSIDPDFFYRQTTVTNPDVDFTVEHIGKVNVVRPRKYQIENYDDDDIIVFGHRKSQRSESSRRKENK